MLDAAMMLTSYALHRTNNNVQQAREWLMNNFYEQTLAAINIPNGWITSSLVPVDRVNWQFSAAMSEWFVSHGVCESLTTEAIAEATEMHTAVSDAIPPPAPGTPVQAPPSPVLDSPTMSTPTIVSPGRVMPLLPAPAFVASPASPNTLPPGAPWLDYPEPGTPSPRALLAPVRLISLDELMG
jgi:hypothetical protein